MRLDTDFYTRRNVFSIAHELLGKVLFTKLKGDLTGGIITEVEAYAGITDRASHAFNGRRTKRTEVMYACGGTAYVYLCYGVHHLFNVVTNQPEVPHAVLVRGIKPLVGIDIIQKRRGKPKNEMFLCNGPGMVTQGLGINISHSGLSLTDNTIWIEDHGIFFRKGEITTSPRIGVDYAGADALLPYRFWVNI